MFRSRSWFGGSLWKNKNPHSLDHLKYLHNVLSKNQSVTENNRSLLVETLRSIAEILIWGDQNDSSVFDFFLEKNMLSFFLEILNQKCGSYVCVQLLQTLNILFENIRNETSLYYLLSNNHVNSIIVHKFDFSDEEIMAYYISFLKTLSLKLNGHTIHFFYNDHTNDFPLYTEAIKFFKHSESMVRIAVRTLTLNVYRVRDTAMLRFIRNRTAVPYFANLVWFIGNHVLDLDTCVRNDADHSSQGRLADLVAEHLDHLHYLNDILCLNISELNDVLVDHLLNKLFIPLYIYSLLPSQPNQSKEARFRVSCVVSLFLLGQIFLITRHEPLVHHLAQIILRGTLTQGPASGSPPVFNPPTHSLEESLESCSLSSTDVLSEDIAGVTNLSITDEEKQLRLSQETPKMFLDVIYNSLDCSENDYAALFSLCLLYAMSTNSGIGADLLNGVLIPSSNSEVKPKYNVQLVQKLLDIISLSCHSDCKVRLATVELAIMLLLRLATIDGTVLLTDAHLAAAMAAREESTSTLRNSYQPEDIFGDMFESEEEAVRKRPLNVECLMMDSNILLPPTGTPLTGIDFTKRLPCGNAERNRKAIRMFLLVRKLCLTLSGEEETALPLTNRSICVKNDTTLDLNNSDLLSCHIIGPDGLHNPRFLVVESNQIILVVPVKNQMGFGLTKLAALLHDIEIIKDKKDSRTLVISSKFTTCGPLSSTRFVFEDNIRCIAALKRLTKGRLKVRDDKMRRIETLLDIPIAETPPYNLLHHRRHHLRLHSSRPLYSHKIPGTATPVIVSASPSRSVREDKGSKGSSPSGSPASGRKSRDGSPRMPRPRSEEIQLENITKRAEARKAAILNGPVPSALKEETKENRETSFSEQPTAEGASTSGGTGKWRIETV